MISRYGLAWQAAKHHTGIKVQFSGWDKHALKGRESSRTIITEIKTECTKQCDAWCNFSHPPTHAEPVPEQKPLASFVPNYKLNVYYMVWKIALVSWVSCARRVPSQLLRTPSLLAGGMVRRAEKSLVNTAQQWLNHPVLSTLFSS